MRLIWAILLLTWLGCSALPAETVNYIAAVVNDNIITYREVELQAEQSLNALQRLYRNQPRLFEEKAPLVMKEALDQLVEKYLILHDYKTSNLKLPDRVIDDEIESRIRKQFGDRMRLIQQLRSEGMSFDTFRQQHYDKLILEIMRHRNVSAAIIISPQKVEQYYATNQAQYQQGDRIKMRAIVLNRGPRDNPEEVRILAQEILTKIEEGVPFTQMAEIYSEGTQRRQGGDWGWAERSRLAKGLSDIAFTLQTNQHSRVLAQARDRKNADLYWMYQYDKKGMLIYARKYNEKGDLVEEKKLEQPIPASEAPVEPDTFYLIQVDDREVARTRPLSEVREEIEQQLKLQEQDRLYKKWMDRLKAKAFIRYF